MAARTTQRLLRRLRELLASTVIAADIGPVAVQDADAAGERGFLGSPTLRIAGQDVEPGTDQRSDFGLKCGCTPRATARHNHGRDHRLPFV